MWEISITTSFKYKKYLIYIKQQLTKSAVYDKGGMVALAKVDEDAVLSIAIKKNILEVKKLLKKLIAEIIVLIEKEKYLKTKTDEFSSNIPCKNAFIKSIVLFDLESDIEMVEKSLNLNSNINTHAYFNFKLTELKHKWDELIKLINNDSIYLNNGEILLEFLKFLIENNRPIYNTLNIQFKDNRFFFCDGKNKRIEDSAFVSTNTDEIDLVTNLIILSPEKINIHCKNNISGETFNLLSFLFENKLCIKG